MFALLTKHSCLRFKCLMFCRLVCDAMAWIKVKVGICMLDVFGKNVELGRIPGS